MRTAPLFQETEYRSTDDTEANEYPTNTQTRHIRHGYECLHAGCRDHCAHTENRRCHILRSLQCERAISEFPVGYEWKARHQPSIYLLCHSALNIYYLSTCLCNGKERRWREHCDLNHTAWMATPLSMEWSDILLTKVEYRPLFIIIKSTCIFRAYGCRSEWMELVWRWLCYVVFVCVFVQSEWRRG